MKLKRCFATTVLSVVLASSAQAQIVSGVMTVTGAEMH
jgi:hypothetical protein